MEKGLRVCQLSWFVKWNTMRSRALGVGFRPRDDAQGRSSGLGVFGVCSMPKLVLFMRKDETVEREEIVEIANIYAVFMQVAENMVGCSKRLGEYPAILRQGFGWQAILLCNSLISFALNLRCPCQGLASDAPALVRK